MTDASHSSEALVERATRGDKAAFGEAFAQFRSRLKQSVSMRMDRRLCGRIDPSDVVQETYLDASRRLDEFVAQGERMPLLLWLRLLAIQRLIDVHRQHLGAQMRDASLELSLDHPARLYTSSIWLMEQLVDEHESASDAAIREELWRQLHEALERLEPLDREVLAMRHFELLSNQEVAQTLEISFHAASKRYIRALRKLKAILNPDARETS